jgi:hypothetical protein
MIQVKSGIAYLNREATPQCSKRGYPESGEKDSMSNKTSEEIPKSTPDNWEALQILFLGLKDTTQERSTNAPESLDNWSVLQSLFQLNPKTSENSSPTPSPTNKPEIDQPFPLNPPKVTSVQFIPSNTKPGNPPSKNPVVVQPTHNHTIMLGDIANPFSSNIPITDTAKPSNPTSNPPSHEIPATVAEQLNDLFHSSLRLEKNFKVLKKNVFWLPFISIALIPLLLLLEINLSSIAFIFLLFWLEINLKRWNSSSSTRSKIYIIYVDPVNGSDSNNGTQSAPFKTLSHALKQADSDR